MGGATAWVFAMVVLGGVTRLTRSGLSMTDWKFTGERPPMSDAEWHAEFSKYQQSPEYRKVNRSMTVDEFKFIYWVSGDRGVPTTLTLPCRALAGTGA